MCTGNLFEVKTVYLRNQYGIELYNILVTENENVIIHILCGVGYLTRRSGITVLEAVINGSSVEEVKRNQR
jgi:hypothetical protein